MKKQTTEQSGTLDFHRYRLVVRGNPKKGERLARIVVPFLSDTGVLLGFKSVVLEHEEFNVFWSSFGSDKAVARIFGEKLGIVINEKDVDDNVVNIKNADK